MKSPLGKWYRRVKIGETILRGDKFYNAGAKETYPAIESIGKQLDSSAADSCWRFVREGKTVQS